MATDTTNTGTTGNTTTDPQGTPGQQDPPGRREDQQDPPEPQGEQQGGDQGGNAEAARYRRRLRDAEASRDSLQERVQGYQRATVARLAEDQLAQPGDLFDVGGSKLEDLLDEAGEVDAEKVTAAVAALLESRPMLAKPADPVWPGMGQGKVGEGGKPVGWGKLFGR